jgi:NAD-dependent dihydropyrimidine dehydrogenase PreA subunit
MMPRVVIDYSKCNLSKQCIDVCPMGVFELRDGRMVAAKQEDCSMCLACTQSCPQSAITVTDEKPLPVEEQLKTAKTK